MQKITNTYLSNDSTRRCVVFVDGNGHYTIKKFELQRGEMLVVGLRTYKHFESAKRAAEKWIKNQ